MGLRIHTNVSAITSLRLLRINDRAQRTSLERLSTGLRINRAGDDPAGLVISEQLRAQLGSLDQAHDNTENDLGVIATADAALQEVQDRLRDIQASVLFALNTGGNSADQIEAEQETVDDALAAISRIADTTRFADGSLLNGTKELSVSSISITGASGASGISDFEIRRSIFAAGQSSRTFTLSQIREASRAILEIGSAGADSPFGLNTSRVVIRISGPRGSSDVTLAGNATNAMVASAINQVSGFTGAFAERLDINASFAVLAEDFGSDNSISVELLEAEGGLDTGIAFATVNPTTSVSTAVDLDLLGERLLDRGGDAQVRLNGRTYDAVRNGREFRVNTSDVDFRFALRPPDDTGGVTPYPTLLQFGGTAPASTGVYRIGVRNSGMVFQLGIEARLSDQIQLGIRNVSSESLGKDAYLDVIARAIGAQDAEAGGRLTSLRSGGENDLFSDNLGRAQEIVDGAMTQVNGLRAFLGSLTLQNLGPNLRSLEVQTEQISAVESQIRDLDYAEETANFTKVQILFQAGVASLASANAVPQAVLRLLQV